MKLSRGENQHLVALHVSEISYPIAVAYSLVVTFRVASVVCGIKRAKCATVSLSH